MPHCEDHNNNNNNNFIINLAGDLKGRVGSKVNNRVVGPFGEETTNESGKRLINMCETYNLKITNPFFCHKNIHRYTWE